MRARAPAPRALSPRGRPRQKNEKERKTKPERRVAPSENLHSPRGAMTPRTRPKRQRARATRALTRGRAKIRSLCFRTSLSPWFSHGSCVEETMRGFAIAAGLLTLATGMACSSSPGPNSSNMQGSQCNPCTDGGGQMGLAPAGSGHDSNPDGVAYPMPTGGYGHNARAGSTPGSIIANYKFLGYPNPQ